MRIVFIGTGDIGLPTLSWLIGSGEHQVLGVVTQQDKPVGRKQELTAPPVKQLALGHHVPIFQPAKIRDPHAIEQIHFLRPEVIVVMAYGQILPGAIWQRPTVACLNLHASLLPRHRGAAPIQAAIRAGDAESGITVMYVNAGLDTGDVLLERRLRLARRETGGSLHDKLAELAPGALAEALTLLNEGRAPRVPQDDSAATQAPKLAREDGRLDWARPNGEIERTIRAFDPWPSAFTLVPSPDDGPRLKLKIFASLRSGRATSGAVPGQVLAANRRGLLVATGAGALLLREVQLEGKRRLPAREFLRGFPLAEGTILG